MDSSYNYHSIKIQAMAVSPADAKAELQIVCFPDYQLNQTMSGGTEAVDSKFNGEIRNIRLNGTFHGHRFETLLLNPSVKKIGADSLLLVGLGDEKSLALPDIEVIGRILVNEAIKLGLRSVSFAPSIKDAGISKFEPSEVSFALSKGMIQAIDHAKDLVSKGLIPSFQLGEITLLAGAKHVESALEGLKKAFQNT